MDTIYYESPVGVLTLKASEQELFALNFGGGTEASNPTNTLLQEAVSQLEQYFQGKRNYFDLPLHLSGTPFQTAVWQSLLSIPYGSSASYQDIALAVNNPLAMRAVGMANNKNKIAIIIPCHRVIGKHGSLVGYAGGLDTKRWLLDFEREHAGT